MARKRLIAPEFFVHPGLYALEASTMLPVRLAFAGLWTLADRRGIFAWKPVQLKLAILPYDAVEFAPVLEALANEGYIKRYEVDGEPYGIIPKFNKWQTFHINEKASKLPGPPRHGASTVSAPCTVLAPCEHSASTPVTGTVAVTGTIPITGAGADEEPAAAADEVAAFVARWEFGPYAGVVEGLIRSARSPEAVMGVFRTHLDGVGQPQSPPLVVGQAAQEYGASGEPPLKANFFAGIVRGVKRRQEENGNRQRRANESEHIQREVEERRERQENDAEVEAMLSRFKFNRPDRFAELEADAEREVPTSITFGRPLMVRSALAKAIRHELGGRRVPA